MMPVPDVVHLVIDLTNRVISPVTVAAECLRAGSSRPIDSVLFGIGVVILMNTRPFEGGILTLAVLIYVFPAALRGFEKHPVAFQQRS